MEFVEEAIISGFIGKVISDCVDVSWKKIKEVVKNKNSRYQNIESQIYNIVVNVLNQITYNKFEKNQDIIYQSAEKLLMSYKDNKCDNYIIVRSSFLILNEYVNDDKYMTFKILLYQELCKDDYEELYRQIRLLQQDIENNKISKIEHKVDKVQKGVDETNQLLYEIRQSYDEPNNIQNKTLINNRRQEYADKWNDNMFLNDFNKRDENAGINIKLSEVYLQNHLPHYIWNTNKDVFYDLQDLLTEYIGIINEKQILLILGQPGIGKSTLITWITNYYAFKADNILVYQFAFDLKNIDWGDINILNIILERLNIKLNELEDKILILDGFDEIHVKEGRENILNRLNLELKKINSVKNCTIIVTCRENYILDLQNLQCNFITLQVWDDEQIKTFCNIYTKRNQKTISNNTLYYILKNKEILGTPLILYMVLALNINIDKNGSIIDIYDKIFALNGGSIYDRCIRHLRYAPPHRISEIKQQIHQISQEIAFWIFENNAEEAFISQDKYEAICDTVVDKMKEKNEEVKQDFLIGNYFKSIKHCESIGTTELHFVHRSIYEYFICEHIFTSMREIESKKEIIRGERTILKNESTEKEWAELLKYEIIGEWGKLLKYGRLTKQTLEFIKYKFNNFKPNNKSEFIKDVFETMLQDGMTCHTKLYYESIIDREINVFANMLDIVHLWNPSLGNINSKIVYYLKYNKHNNLNLRGIQLHEVDLNKVFLVGANLDEAKLEKIKLERTDLSEAYLRSAILNGAILNGAILNGANFMGADLNSAYLINAELKRADLSGANLISTKLIEAKLNNAELISSTLIKAKLNGAELINAKLDNARLNDADLRGAKIYGIKLKGAYLRNAIFDEKQVNILKEEYDLSNIKVYIYKTKKIITYEEYNKQEIKV